MKLHILALAMSVSAVPAVAGEFYVTGSLGGAAYDYTDAEFHTANDALASAGFSGSASLDRGDTAYKLQLGYQFNPYLAVEGGYVNLGEALYKADGRVGPVPASLRSSVKASGFNLAAVGTYPVSDSFALFGKLGVINATVDSATSFNLGGIPGTDNHSTTDLKTNWGVGVRYQFAKQVGLRVELEQFRKLGNAETSGKEVNVNLFSAGVQYTF